MLHIKSNTPALIVVNKEYLIKNSTQDIPFPDQNLIIKYYPLDRQINGKIAIPSVVKIDLLNLKNCDDFSVTKYPNNHIEITLKPFLLSNNLRLNTTLQRIENSQKSIEIYTSKTTTFCIKNSENYSYFELPFIATFICGIEIKGVLHLFFKEESSPIYALIKDEKIVIYDDLKDFTFSSKKLSVIVPNFDMAKTGKAIEIDFLKATYSEKVIYINNHPDITQNIDLIPYAFIESIKAKNFKLSRQYITKNMSEKLSDRLLGTFFGNIEKITHDPYNDKLCIITESDDTFCAKDYSFEFQNNKISDINEL